VAGRGRVGWSCRVRAGTVPGRGLAVSARVWWAWVRVMDFCDASKAADRMADEWREIAVIRRRRGVITLVATGATALGGLIA